MSKNLLKVLLWAVIGLALLAGAWLALRGAAGLVAYFQGGADPASALNIVPNVPPDLAVRAQWLADDADIGRPMEPETRRQIEATYLRAWLQWNLSYAKGEPYGLKTYFVGPALEGVSEAVALAGQGGRIDQVDSVHNLQLHFYAADGSIVSFSDREAPLAHLVYDAAGQVSAFAETTSDYDVVMFLEDGNWRVRHLLRTADTAGAQADEPAAHPGLVTVQGATLALDGVPFLPAGVNYYPQATPWHLFWPAYDPAVVDQDLARMATLGLNAVRIFVPFEQFGGATVQAGMLDRLEDLLERAQAHGIKVMVTLFDFRTDYSPLLWPQSDRHLEQVLGRFAGHPAILAWDIKNEPDLDYAANGEGLVDAWLAHTLRLARAVAPGHPLTVGWSTAAAAAQPDLAVDVVSFHHYGPADELPGHIAALRAALPDRPLLLSEFGLPTWNSVFPNGHTEAEQSHYYAEVLAIARGQTGDPGEPLAGTLAWTLYDFTQAPAQVTGRLPWRRGPQMNLGVIGQDGQLKPAAALLAPDASLAVPRPPGWARWLKPFWLLVFGVGLAVGALLWWLARRRGLRREAGRGL